MCDGKETNAQNILGEIDAAKFRSCMTLFEFAAPHDECFKQAIELFFGGVRDQKTIRFLGMQR